MKQQRLLLALLASAICSLASPVTADWDTGPCPGGGTAPCIEAEVSGNTYHFNGTGDHAGEWHGLPTTGEDFEFSGATAWGCRGRNFNCTLTWGARIKKCQDSNGDWRLGLQMNSVNVSGGLGCASFALGSFPWYTKDPHVANHCPFEDDCDSFIPYETGAPNYTTNLGAIDLAIFGIPLIADGHLHGVVFTPGIGANFAFDSEFYGCDDESQGCWVEGALTVTNATSLDVQ